MASREPASRQRRRCRLRPRPCRPRAAGGPHPGVVHAPGGPVAAGVPGAAGRDGDARGMPGPGPGHRDHPAAGAAARRGRGDPLLRHRPAAGRRGCRHRDQAGGRAGRRHAPPVGGRRRRAAAARAAAAGIPADRRAPAGRRAGPDAADRLRRGAVHPRDLSHRGRPLQGARPHEGLHVRRARGVVAAARPAGGLRGDVPARAGRRRRLGRAAVRQLGRGALGRRLRPAGAAALPGGVRRAGVRRRAEDPLRSRHRRAAPADRRRRSRRRGGRLAGAPRRGRPPGGARAIPAGQPRPGRAARRPRHRRPRGAPRGRAGPGRPRARVQPRPRRAARDRPRRAHPRRRPGPRADRGPMTRVAIVGAGITGLAAAFEWRHRRPDDEIVVLEAGDRVGGKVRRIELAGRWYDTGPEALLARVPEAVRLVERLGMADQLVVPATTQAAVVLPDGRHPLPAGTVLGVPASADGLEGLLSPDGVARVRAEADLPPVTLDGDVGVGVLLRDRLGDEIVDRLVEPLLGGVYAGRADELSLAATMPALAGQLPRTGSVLAAAAAARDAGARSRGDADGPVFATVQDGIGALPAALAAAARADVRLRSPAHALRRTPGGFELSVGLVAAPESLTADAVVVTAPAVKAARLLADVAPGAVEPLQGIPYASMAVVEMAFPAQEVAAGSGLLIPPLTGRLVKGVTVSSAKWPHLAGDALLVRASVGRFRDEAELQREDADLTAAVVADVADLLELSRPEPVQTVLARWGGGLPQYLVGHPARVAAVGAAVGGVPGLAIGGAAFEGLGVPACIRDAHRAVESLL